MQESHLSDLVITGIRTAFTMYNSAGSKGRRHDRPCWALIYKYEGATRYRQHGAEYLSDSSHAVIIPKASSYEWECVDSGHYFDIEFESDAPFEGITLMGVKNRDKLIAAFRQIEHKLLLQPPAPKIELLRDLYSLILTQHEKRLTPYAPTSKQLRLKPALDYIAANYREKLSNDELAAMCRMSTSYFRKLFSHIMGTSPIEYVNTLRINKAKEMLVGEYSSMTDISSQLGYTSIYDFSRAFKKFTGVSPTKYRD